MPLTKEQRDLLKRARHGVHYGMGRRKLTEGFIDESATIPPGTWAALKRTVEEYMKQRWIIDGEWSQYHVNVAHQKGWGITQVQGLWQVVTTSPTLFPTNEAAKAHVLACEADPTHPEHTLACIATNAIVVGSIRG